MFRPKVNTIGGIPINTIYIWDSEIKSKEYGSTLVEVGSGAKVSADLFGNYTSKTVNPDVDLYNNGKPIPDLKANIITTKSKTNDITSLRTTFVITKPSTEFYFAFTISIIDSSKISKTNAIVSDSNRKEAVGKTVTISYLKGTDDGVFAIKADDDGIDGWCSDWVQSCS